MAVSQRPKDRDAPRPERASVLALLSPLTPTYTRRVAVGEPRASAPAPAHAVADRLLLPTPVQSIITIEPRGRVPWRTIVRQGEAVVSLEVDGGLIRVTVGAKPGHQPRRLDRRGRLLIPRGLLQAVGLSPGDRLAVLRSGSEFVLTPLERSLEPAVGS